jgi:hypothetical protein
MLRHITNATEEVAANEHLAQCKDFCSRFALIAGGTPAVPVVGSSGKELVEIHLRGHLRQFPNARPFDITGSVFPTAGNLVEDQLAKRFALAT